MSVFNIVQQWRANRRAMNNRLEHTAGYDYAVGSFLRNERTILDLEQEAESCFGFEDRRAQFDLGMLEGISRMQALGVAPNPPSRYSTVLHDLGLARHTYEVKPNGLS